MSKCSACGAAIDPSIATYDNAGNLVCAKCAERQQLAEGMARTTASGVGTLVGAVSALGVFGLGLLSVMPVLSEGRERVDSARLARLCIIPIVAGVTWLLMIERAAVRGTGNWQDLNRATSRRVRMGNGYIMSVIAVAIGLLLAVATLVVVGSDAVK